MRQIPFAVLQIRKTEPHRPLAPPASAVPKNRRKGRFRPDSDRLRSPSNPAPATPANLSASPGAARSRRPPARLTTRADCAWLAFQPLRGHPLARCHGKARGLIRSPAAESWIASIQPRQLSCQLPKPRIATLGPYRTNGVKPLTQTRIKLHTFLCRPSRDVRQPFSASWLAAPQTRPSSSLNRVA